MNQFCVLNRLKALKKTSSGLIGRFNIKKFEFYLRALFYIKLFYFFFAFLSHLGKSHFSYRVYVNDKPP